MSTRAFWTYSIRGTGSLFSGESRASELFDSPASAMRAAEQSIYEPSGNSVVFDFPEWRLLEMGMIADEPVFPIEIRTEPQSADAFVFAMRFLD